MRVIWTPAHAEWWKSIIETENGQRLLEALRAKRPSPLCPSVEHQSAYVLGAVGGHEQAQTDLVNLSLVKPPVLQPEANYGVPTPKTAKAAPA